MQLKYCLFNFIACLSRYIFRERAALYDWSSFQIAFDLNYIEKVIYFIIINTLNY